MAAASWEAAGAAAGAPAAAAALQRLEAKGSRAAVAAAGRRWLTARPRHRCILVGGGGGGGGDEGGEHGVRSPEFTGSCTGRPLSSLLSTQVDTAVANNHTTSAPTLLIKPQLAWRERESARYCCGRQAECELEVDTHRLPPLLLTTTSAVTAAWRNKAAAETRRVAPPSKQPPHHEWCGILGSGRR